ncbi:MAG TPA: GPW/gp25 family protein, partial [Thermoleophilia bacterium]|nr:GPW/gp25 family protein [Thermoleophilia bacterium]
MSATTNFLGSGLAYPFRRGKSGLPDMEFGVGEEAVRGMVSFMLRTAPGDIWFDPGLGLDPENFRYDPTDLQALQDLSEAIRIGLLDVDPRIRTGSVSVAPIPGKGQIDTE